MVAVCGVKPAVWIDSVSSTGTGFMNPSEVLGFQPKGVNVL